MKKYSRQREAVYEAVCSVRSHPTADEVYDSVKKKLPNVSLATVYRNLSLLCSEGKLIMINTGDGASHYDGFTEKHHHLVCSERCIRDRAYGGYRYGRFDPRD